MIHHANDHARQNTEKAATQLEATLGYTLGLNRDVKPYERAGFEGGYKTRHSTPEQRHMAGDALNLDLRQSLGTPKFPPLLDIGGAELRTPYLPQ